MTPTLMALEFPEPQGAEAWLLTYGPGDVYWQRFGHNSIWLRDQARGINHTFNFGYFDFNQPGFLRRFVQGRMLYFGAAFDPLKEIEEYEAQGRTVRAQRLQLSPGQVSVLETYLVNEVQPENRDYLYDYFYANCSTRVRDALDMAMDGALYAETGDTPGGQTIREHVNRLSWPDPWLFLGLQTALGMPVDGPASRWQEAFIPGQLADIVAAHKLEDGQPLVSETLYSGDPSQVGAPDTTRVWGRYLAWGALPAALLFLAGALRSGRGLQKISGRWPALLWPLLAGTAGWFLVYMWLATDHAAAANNWSLLVLNPLLLPVAIVALRRHSRPALLAVAALLGLGWFGGLLAWWLIPTGQDNPSLLALTLPLLLVSGWRLVMKKGSD